MGLQFYDTWVKGHQFQFHLKVLIFFRSVESIHMPPFMAHDIKKAFISYSYLLCGEVAFSEKLRIRGKGEYILLTAIMGAKFMSFRGLEIRIQRKTDEFT